MNGCRRIRVVFVLTTPDAVGGTERATYQVAAQLARHDDLDVSVLGVLRERDAPHFAGDVTMPLHHLLDVRPARAGRHADEDRPSSLVDARWEPVFSARTDHLVAEALSTDPPDVVVATTPALLALVAQVAAPGTAIVGVEHRATAARGVSGEPLGIYGGSAEAIVSLTADGSDWFARRLGEHCPPLATIPNMVPAGFVPQSSLHQPLVVAAGRLVRSKQFNHVVQAFDRSRRTGWRLRIFGDGPERRSIERLVMRLGLHDHVDLVPSVDDVRYELAKASMLVMTSTAEGFPLVALEAIATGVPIVSYDCPVGPRAVVDHDVNGSLVPPNDIDTLAAQIGRLMDDVVLRRRLGEGARARRAEFAPGVIGDAWADLLRSIGRSGVPRRHAIRTSRARPPHAAGDDAASVRGAPELDQLGARSVGGPWVPKSDPWVPKGGLLVHIGPHKTGTTAIQSAFAAARAALAAEGVTYPGIEPAPHRAVRNRLGTRRGWDDAIAPGPIEPWDQLCVETRTAAGTVVVSSEAFCHATVEQAAALGPELRPGPVRVAMTVRPLERVLGSSWQEYVKSGWTTPFDDFLHAVLERPDDARNPTPTFWVRQDHGALVERWAEAVGADNVVVVVADPTRRDHLHRTFEERLGLPAGILPVDAGPVNRSLRAAEAELLRRVNLAVGRDVSWYDFHRLLCMGGITELVEQRTPGADESGLRVPAWAVERARELGAVAIERIEAAGVDVVGDLTQLSPTTDLDAEPEPDIAAVADDPSGDPSVVSIDAVVSVIDGILAARAPIPPP